MIDDGLYYFDIEYNDADYIPKFHIKILDETKRIEMDEQRIESKHPFELLYHGCLKEKHIALFTNLRSLSVSSEISPELEFSKSIPLM